MEGGKTANYWPGFVDALTNVVIAMVFVIVVLAMALSFAAQLMSKRLAQQYMGKQRAAQAASAPADKRRPLPTKLELDTSQTSPQAQETSKARDRIEPKVIKVDAHESAESSSGGRVQTINNVVRLDYADTALTLDFNATEALRSAMAAQKARTIDAQIIIVARGRDMELSDNQRAAYLRVLAVRNELIDDGFKTDRIIVRIDTEHNDPHPSVTISFQDKP